MSHFDTVFNAKDAKRQMPELTYREAQLWARLGNQAVEVASVAGASPRDAVRIAMRKTNAKMVQLLRDEGKRKTKDVPEAGE